MDALVKHPNFKDKDFKWRDKFKSLFPGVKYGGHLKACYLHKSTEGEVDLHYKDNVEDQTNPQTMNTMNTTLNFFRTIMPTIVTAATIGKS
ncbi:serine-protein kinase ATM-like protein [Corchorus olitorius]|uniref:Serine-protein kinase ATM-like protein n=1 Tax=Corchorus olitorius TaxID=93759 RepID=A0A1R3H8S5_9ROSI|nr:serine-protein kinase ATM-like protein [Corchorus olitorius]